jgi:hypothetical protein
VILRIETTLTQVKLDTSNERKQTTMNTIKPIQSTLIDIMLKREDAFHRFHHQDMTAEDRAMMDKSAANMRRIIDNQ